MTTRIFSIGHSNHDWDTFSQLLIDNEIELLVDVRSKPVSRFAPFSNRRRFPGLLDSIAVGYQFMGGPLGGRSADEAIYDSSGKPDYDKMRLMDGFQDAIDELIDMASHRRTVILCSEGDPANCHRRLLLGPPIGEAGVELLHIMRDGDVRSDSLV